MSPMPVRPRYRQPPPSRKSKPHSSYPAHSCDVEASAIFRRTVPALNALLASLSCCILKIDHAPPCSAHQSRTPADFSEAP